MLVRAESEGASVGATFTVEPADAATLLPGGRLALQRATDVTLRATTASGAASRLFAVAVPPTIVFDLQRDGNRDVWRAALDGGDAAPVASAVGEDREPTCAADVVVFVSFRDRNAELYSSALRAATSDAPTRLTRTTAIESAPSLSTTGTRLAYVSDASGLPRVVVDERRGAAAARLTSTPDVFEASPAWAPAGDRLVFTSSALGSARVFVATPGGPDTATVLVDTATSVEPAWSADGATIAFTSNRRGGTRLFLADRDGRRQRLLGDPTTTVAESQPAWLPDGRLLFVRGSGAAARLFWLNPARPAVVREVAVPAGAVGNPSGCW